MITLAPIVDRLREENEELLAEVGDLKAQLGLDADAVYFARCRDVLGITRGQARILRVLIARPIATRSNILRAISATEDEAQDRDDQIIGVQVHHLRGRLRRRNAPIAIENVWGVGYRLDDVSKRTLRELLEDAAP